MRLATWNINSVRTRVERVTAFLERESIDVLAMQETKCRPDQFPREAFEAAGYEVAVHGLDQWNGVAVASRVGLSDVVTAFPGQPGWTRKEGQEPVVEARALGVTVGGRLTTTVATGTSSGAAPAVGMPGGNTTPAVEIPDGAVTHPDQAGPGASRSAASSPDESGHDAVSTTSAAGSAPLRLWSLYVPNGRELDHPHYRYKLEWLAALREAVGGWLSADPGIALALVGDWNVAPRDEDVWDISVFEGATHVSAPEREALAALETTGLSEVTRERVTNYTYWDYQRLRFPRNEGMRIDFVYASPSLAARVRGASIDRDERKGKGASDHVPVIVEVEG